MTNDQPDKLMVVIRAIDQDLRRLSTALSTLADAPPVIPYEVTVLGEPGRSNSIAAYCLQCSGLVYRERMLYPGAEVDLIGDGCNLRLLVHPDVLFINRNWCEVIFSKMIESGAAIIGAMPFKQAKAIGIDVSTYSSWFMAYDANQVGRSGGFSCDAGEGAWLLGYLRAKKAGLHCVGADLSALVVHGGTCWLDEPKSEEEASRESQSVDVVVTKENLL